MLRKILLTLALVLLPVFALPDVLVIPTIRMGKGYAGPVGFSAVYWADGTSRSLTGATGTLTVYRTAPVAGVGGVVLFSKSLAPSGVAFIATVTGTDTATPGTYYAEVTIVQDGVTDALHGSVVIEGL